MSSPRKPISILAALVAVSLGAVFTAAGAMETSQAAARCEIITKKSGGLISIQAQAHADKAVSGSYEFSVTGSGTNLNQGGDFDGAAGETISLGSAMLIAGQALDVELSVRASGSISKCSERLG